MLSSVMVRKIEIFPKSFYIVYIGNIHINTLSLGGIKSVF